MYLTKFTIPLASRQAVNCLRDAQQMHVAITKLFGNQRGDANILYRTDIRGGDVRIYAYSDTSEIYPAQDVSVAGQRDLTEWLQNNQRGKLFSFDVLTVPAKKVAEAGVKNSRRRILRTPEERESWLMRKAEQNGFRILQAEELQRVPVYAKHPEGKGNSMNFDAFHFRGILCVEDGQLFQKAVSGGIGSGKAYGCGMLLLKAL